jgi:phosphopantothenoylcysteine decarboxylase/phosphopantothenate--cysteine ligase
MSASRVVLIGVGGGIAAYKTVEVASALVKAGHEVHVAMTAAARHLVTPTTFASITRRRVIAEMFPPAEQTDGEDLFPHLYPATRADVFLVAPATADLIARFAAGLADDVVCCSAVALRPECRRVFCPSMNANMWANPTVRANARRLEESGWRRIGPAEGALACGTTGVGRMSEPAEIVAALADALR